MSGVNDLAEDDVTTCSKGLFELARTAWHPVSEPPTEADGDEKGQVFLWWFETQGGVWTVSTVVWRWAVQPYAAVPTTTDTRGVSAFESASIAGPVGSMGSRSADIAHLERALDNLLAYATNWDGHGGVPPSPDAVRDAKAFLRQLPLDAVLPRLGLAGDGEIGFFWDTDSSFIDVGFVGDGQFSFYSRTSKGKEHFGDGDSVYSELPEELASAIANYS